MRYPFILLSLLCTFLCAATAHAFPGKVIHIADGDTITVLAEGHRQVKIRLYGIDCPEKRQAFGNRARQHMGRLVGGQTVEVEDLGTDRYGRTLGIVFSPDGANINRQMVDAGMAWVYRQYCKRPECREWMQEEKEAKAAGRGLWAEPNAVPPWTWRKMQRAKPKE